MNHWIITANIDRYNLFGALTNLPVIDWVQNHGKEKIETGDIVFVYVCEPINAICFKCKVLKVNKKGNTIDDTDYQFGEINETNCKYFEIQKLEEYDPNMFGQEILGRLNYREGNIRSGCCNITDKSELLNFLLKENGKSNTSKSKDDENDNSLDDEYAMLSEIDGQIVQEREYKEKYNRYKKEFHSSHGDIQQKLIKKLKKKYKSVGSERKLGSVRIDVLVILENNTYDIYEIKPYDSPEDCIREALGQVILYKYKFENNKHKYKVNSLYIVGPNRIENNSSEARYLDLIKQLCPKLIIDYKTPDEF